MDRVTILTTNPAAARFDEFSHGEAALSFGLLAPDGPRQLLEGQVWAFIDWVLEDLSGLEMCRRLRASQHLRESHITMVLEEDNPEDRRRAIKAGADDYCIGPITRQSMLDRVLALFASERQMRGVQMLEQGALMINLASQQARWNGEAITLRPNEFRLLRFLAENPNRVLSRQDLVDALGKAGDPGYLRTVDVWIKRLRSGLRHVGAQDLLRTVHGQGYVLDLN